MSWDVWGPPIVILLVSLIIGLILVIFWQRNPPVPVEEDDRAQALRARKAALLDQLRALELDRSKMDPAEHAAQREALLAEAAEVLKMIEDRDDAPAVAPSEESIEDKLKATGPASKPKPKAVGNKLAWFGGTVAFFVLLAGGLSEFSKPKEAGMTMTGGPNAGTQSGEISAAIAEHQAQVSAAQQALETNPKDLQALNTLTYSALMQRDFKVAMQYLDVARVEAPEDPDVLTHLAILQMVIGMADKAEEALEQAVAVAPDRGKPRIWWAMLAAQRGDADRARTLLSEAEKLGLDLPEKELATSIRAQLSGVSAASPPSTAASAAPVAAGPARVSGRLALADGASPPAGGIVFLIAQRAEQAGGPPVAAKRINVADLPVDFALSDSDMMLGGAWPEQVWITARVDADGNPSTKSEADLKAPTSGPHAAGATEVSVVLGGS